MGQSPNGVNYTSNPEDYILVQGNADMENGKVIPRVWTTQITKLAKSNDLIFSVRTPVGSVGKTDYSLFLNASMSSRWYEKFINLNVAGGNGAIGNLSKSNLDEYEILVPSNNEKSIIGELFQSIDSLITLYQRK